MALYSRQSDHINDHISTNLQRQKLSICASESHRCNASFSLYTSHFIPIKGWQAGCVPEGLGEHVCNKYTHRSIYAYIYVYKRFAPSRIGTF